MIRITFVCILISNLSFAQVNDNFIQTFVMDEALLEENTLHQYQDKDFSNLWVATDNSLVYGIIGEDHQRIRIKFLAIKKNPFNAREYIVRGKSMVKETICEFLGVIRLKTIKEVKTLHYGVDDEYQDKQIQAQGLVIADYELMELKTQHHSGIFKGKLYTKWYLDSNQVIQFDNIEASSDDYMNNSFIGTWKNYVTGKEKNCNWGDYRVPEANEDFDIGVSEFSVSQKYLENGWLDTTLERQISNSTIKRESKEKINNKVWWEE